MMNQEAEESRVAAVMSLLFSLPWWAHLSSAQDSPGCELREGPETAGLDLQAPSVGHPRQLEPLLLPLTSGCSQGAVGDSMGQRQ